MTAILRQAQDEAGVKKRALAAQKEFPATDEAFARVRAALVVRLFETAQAQAPERERLYQTVQVLDAVREALLGVIGQGQAAIDEYVKALTRPT